MANGDGREQLQRLAMEAEYHQRQAQDLQAQIQSLQQLEMELERTKEALGSLVPKKTGLLDRKSVV